jgi:hypothetical protein
MKTIDRLYKNNKNSINEIVHASRCVTHVYSVENIHAKMTIIVLL